MPTWVQLLAWVFGWFLLAPIALLGGALTGGAFTPGEVAERARVRVAGRVPTDPVMVAVAAVAYCALFTLVLQQGMRVGTSVGLDVVLIVTLIAIQPVAAFVIARAWAFWLPGLAYLVAGVWVSGMGTPAEQDAVGQSGFGLGIILYWPAAVLLMTPGLLLRRFVHRRRLRQPPRSSDLPTGISPPLPGRPDLVDPRATAESTVRPRPRGRWPWLARIAVGVAVLVAIGISAALPQLESGRSSRPPSPSEASPAGVVPPPPDGSWVGSTSQGTRFTLGVTDGSVTSLDVRWKPGGRDCPVRIAGLELPSIDLPIVDGAFAIEHPAIEGRFRPDGVALGTARLRVSNRRCEAVSLTWEARR